MTYTTCERCGQEMAPHGGRTFDAKARVPWDGPWVCNDCGVGPGRLHHPGCDMERCPDCDNQAIICGHGGGAP